MIGNRCRRKTLNSENLLPCWSYPINVCEDGRIHLSIFGVKVTGKPFHYFPLNVTMNHNNTLWKVMNPSIPPDMGKIARKNGSYVLGWQQV